MTEEEVRKQLEEGCTKIQPKVGEMTNLMMDCYHLGFKTCWKILTGQDWV